MLLMSESYMKVEDGWQQVQVVLDGGWRKGTIETTQKNGVTTSRTIDNTGASIEGFYPDWLLKQAA